MIYLDNAATTLYKPRAVEQAVRRAMYGAAGYARGGYAAASRAGELVYTCRGAGSGAVRRGRAWRVIFTLNATHALNIAINALVKPDSRVIVSGYEHNAVMRPLTARNIEPTVLDTPLWDGAAMVSALKQALEHGADLMILSHVSNVFGSIAPLDEIAELLTAAGVPLILDASQSAGVAEIDVKALSVSCGGVHARTQGAVRTDGHGHSAGARRPDCREAAADRRNGQSVRGDAPAGFSAGCARERHAERARHRGSRGGHRLCPGGHAGAHCRAGGRLVHELARALSRESKIECFAGKKQTGVLSFRVPGTPSEVLADMLSDEGVCTRAGLHCAPLAHRTAGTEDTGTVRLSLSFYSTARQLEQAADKVCRLVKKL